MWTSQNPKPREAENLKWDLTNSCLNRSSRWVQSSKIQVGHEGQHTRDVIFSKFSDEVNLTIISSTLALWENLRNCMASQQNRVADVGLLGQRATRSCPWNVTHTLLNTHLSRSIWQTRTSWDKWQPLYRNLQVFIQVLHLFNEQFHEWIEVATMKSCWHLKVSWRLSREKKRKRITLRLPKLLPTKLTYGNYKQEAAKACLQIFSGRQIQSFCKHQGSAAWAQDQGLGREEPKKGSAEKGK